MASFSYKEYLEKARKASGYDRLEKRERLTLGIGGIVVVVILILNVIIFPLLDERTRALKKIRRTEGELKRITLLQEEYKKVASKVGGIAERLDQRSSDFTLFSFLESQASEAKVRESVKYMKPSTEEGEGLLQNSVVEMKLEKVPLVQLVDFLKLVESSENVVSVGRISIQESGQGDGLLDVVMQLVTFVKKN